MRNSILFLVSVWCFISCGNPEKKQAAPVDTATATSNTEHGQDYCYEMLEHGDSVRLSYRLSPDHLILGRLDYLLAEKDANRGSVQGFLKGDTLILEYIFKSEGVESSREVAFLMKGDTLEEGYGPQQEKAGKMLFEDHSKITFGQGIILRQCK